MSEHGEVDASAYGAMAEAVRASVEELLIPFNAPPGSQEILRNLTTDEFFQKFLVYADRFTEKCCQDLGKIFRQASALPELRGTPTLQLAKQIREVTFERLDRILVSYLETLQTIHLDLREAATALSESSMLGAAMKAAAIGQVAGGFGDGGKLLGVVGALAAAGKEAAKQQALMEERKRLEVEAKHLAFANVIEYLKAVESMPENLLDYGCSRCFGGAVDFKQQTLAVEKIQTAINERLRISLEFAVQMQERDRAALAEAERLAALEAAKKEQETKRSSNLGCGILVIVVGVIFLGVSVEEALGNGTEAGIAGPGILGAVLLVLGIMAIKRRNKE